MSDLQLNLLGGAEGSVGPGRPLELPTRKAWALLAYLALHPGRALGREQLAALLWGERFDEQARRSLRQALYEIRNALGDGAAGHLKATRDTVALELDGPDVDVRRFEELVADGEPERLAEAEALYRGPLLDGLETGEAGFEDWLAGERARLQELAGRALEKLAAHHLEQDATEAGIAMARRLLQLDPLCEEAHRLLMRGLAADGRRSEALKHYQELEGLLAAELGAKPDPATARLHESLQRGEDPAEAGVERRLTTILAIDAAGYSRLMGDDEAGTLAALKSHRKELFEPMAAQYRGRTVKLMGDGALMEFASVVDAVAFAAELQRAMRKRNQDVPEDRQIQFRIGINIGDIIVEGDDIYGDGVNVAARLESLAEPGGICVARNVFNQVKDKLELDFEHLGERRVKNIAEPVTVYGVVLDGSDARPAAAIPPAASRSALRPALVAAAVVLLVVAGGLAWWRPWQPELEAASLERMAYPLPDKPSIAVLPFDNLSDDPQQDHLADGLTEDLITALSKVPQLFVIARTSVRGYKGKAVKVQTIAEDLGVRYLVEGSVQKAGGDLRVTAQLIDALGGHHLWGDRFDRPVAQVFALQDEIIQKILIELQVKLTSGDHARVASRGTTNLNAWLLRQQGMAELYKFTRETTVRTREIFLKAHELDPNWSRPLGGIAWSYWWEARKGWTDDREGWIRKGVEYAEMAIEVEPDGTIGYMQLGNLAQLQGDHERAIALREKAVALAPNDFQANWGLGAVLYQADQAERAVEVLKHAMRVSPNHPASLLWAVAQAQLVAGHYEDAIETAKRARAKTPDRDTPYIQMAAAYSALGRMEEAREAAAEVLRISPKLTATVYKRGLPDYKNPATVEKLAELLIKAGVPE